jgi:hypothetical protein
MSAARGFDDRQLLNELKMSESDVIAYLLFEFFSSHLSGSGACFFVLTADSGRRT